ncbi:type 1 glutamine amidotransferase domain-containing protein [Acidaminococcus sp. CAG:542]|jgi:putative intracellular protease/amidase|uniref:type 1 glutamine amidotransferase domain-containing protein n=1 Tax=unclassified Acidaminococcus TaxID=2635771 RepID=UPI00033993AF|nr:type 1 glutamine amidotransferase domain-containing protein [Acidaminococcus sp. CAG:542]CDE93813.1 thiJ/PfpI domain protein [Acidaminococcus sp. CAG:542]
MNRFVKLCLTAMLVLPLGILSAQPVSAASAKGKILLIASSENTLELANHTAMPTGFFLNELAVPAEYLTEKGWQIVLATPEGKAPAMDQGSNDKKFFQGSEKERAKAEAFAQSLQPISFQQVLKNGLDQYDALFIPGGHAPMGSLMENRELGTILKDFHAKQKPTAMICHGPAASLAALPDPAAYRKALVERDVKSVLSLGKGWIYDGYAMTALSDAEEWPGEIAKGTEMPFHLEQALQLSGARIQVQGMNQSHVVKDRELITGQNPASDLELAKALEKALEK